MNRIFGVLGGVGVLIGIYLFLRHGEDTTRIIQTVASNSVYGIKTLQGR